MNKEELKEYTQIKKEIDLISNRIVELEHRKTRIKSQIISDMPVGTDAENDRLGLLLVQIEGLISLYNEKQSNLLDKQYAVEEAIEELNSPVERNIMRLRYLNNWKWEKICVEVNYSWKQVHRIHKSILEKIS